MNREKIEKMLDLAGIPYEYFKFEENCGIAPPFMVWYFPESNNFSADGKVYAKICTLNIELYTDEKNETLENVVETALDGQGLFWNKQESYISDEELYEVLYQMEVMIDE